MSEKTGLILLGIIFVILGMTTGIVSAISLGSLPQTLYVDDLDDGPGNNYTSIQAAVDNSSSGDTILVYPGNYSENVYVNVNKPNISIQSVSRNPVDTVISSNSSSVVYI
ncbi:MAG: hypothetical protein PHW56_12515, partial [Methanosarcinaceae archaeon]|nr:hypothetical protein [Methanosarcinaceae archaeon]